MSAWLIFALRAAAVGVGAAIASSGFAAATTYRVVPDKSPLRIEVGKGGAFGFVAGHTHEVEGRIQGRVTADAGDVGKAEIQLTIRTADLRVTGKGEPPDDVPKVQERMIGPDVLDVAQFPEIAFKSTSISVSGTRDEQMTLTVTGDLTLHGRTKPVTAPVRVRIENGSLTAAGTLTVKQSDYGIKPINIGGVVSVKDALTIHFAVTASS